jgi:type I restriction enzyme M protein
MSNLQGYDIDPTMVRIAQVNMYLHQFKNPQIFQYDSLTSEERWNDKYDVILANPPFMSPKGGIKPHNKFGISSNRSEALFVDYIVSHLKPKGRAGIIVPEGVIFKNDSAFKDLRKNLLSNGLYAVVSLPGGVFQPYSGVKTSILLLDNEVSKTQSKIMFINIAADGFDLGATKRVIERNDLPEALALLDQWARGKEIESKLSSYVSKELIAEKSGFNLSGEKYKVGKNSNQSSWEMFALEDILDYEQPTKYIVDSVDYDESYTTPVLTAGKTFVLGKTNETTGIFQDRLPVVIFDDFTTAIKYVDFPFKVKSSAMKILHAKNDSVNIKYVYYAMQNLDFPINEHKRYWISEYSKLQIPLPPLDVQVQVVTELEGFAAIISGAMQIVENWKPRIAIDAEWERRELGDVCEVYQPKTITGAEILEDGPFKVYGANGVIGYYDKFNHPDAEVAITCRGATCGTVNFTEPESWITGNAMVVSPKDKTLSKKFLQYLLIGTDLSSVITGSAQPQITGASLKPFEIPVPPIATQEEIVELIDREAALVSSAKQLIEVYETRTKIVIDKLWIAEGEIK